MNDTDGYFFSYDNCFYKNVNDHFIISFISLKISAVLTFMDPNRVKWTRCESTLRLATEGI